MLRRCPWLTSELESTGQSQYWRIRLISKNTICLWYDGTALEAATFYAETFPDSEVGAAFRHSEAFSFQVATDDQAETDRLWNAIVENGGEESACGWCKDKWGLSWQITPRALTEAIANPDRAAAKRAFAAMMDMGKIDIAMIEAA
jgi:predicted 3-demethylubiquinone-9 3-methyltransferase (glyoxalase superfamily)